MNIYKELYSESREISDRLGAVIGNAQGMIYALRLDLKYKTSALSETEYRLIMAAKCDEIYAVMKEGFENAYNRSQSKTNDNE